MPTTLANVAAKSAAGADSTARGVIDRVPALPTNVGDTERLLSGLAGGALAVFGFTGRGPGLLSALVGGSLLWRGVTGHCACYRAMGINTGGPGGAASVPAGHGVRVEESVVVNKPVAEVYRAWRKFDQLPRFMTHLKEVRDLGNGKSHWVAKAPLGMTVEWDAEIVTERENELIGWKSLPGADVDTAGSVHFWPAPGTSGTKVTVILKYDPPAGKVGAAAARWLGGAPGQQVRDDLRRFKEMMEGGGGK
jgi:uncharacterized membrane protein